MPAIPSPKKGHSATTSPQANESSSSSSADKPLTSVRKRAQISVDKISELLSSSDGPDSLIAALENDLDKDKVVATLKAKFAKQDDDLKESVAINRELLDANRCALKGFESEVQRNRDTIWALHIEKGALEKSKDDKINAMAAEIETLKSENAKKDRKISTSIAVHISKDDKINAMAAKIVTLKSENAKIEMLKSEIEMLKSANAMKDRQIAESAEEIETMRATDVEKLEAIDSPASKYLLKLHTKINTAHEKIENAIECLSCGICMSTMDGTFGEPRMCRECNHVFCTECIPEFNPALQGEQHSMNMNCPLCMTGNEYIHRLSHIQDTIAALIPESRIQKSPDLDTLRPHFLKWRRATRSLIERAETENKITISALRRVSENQIERLVARATEIVTLKSEIQTLKSESTRVENAVDLYEVRRAAFENFLRGSLCMLIALGFTFWPDLIIEKVDGAVDKAFGDIQSRKLLAREVKAFFLGSS